MPTPRQSNSALVNFRASGPPPILVASIATIAICCAPSSGRGQCVDYRTIQNYDWVSHVDFNIQSATFGVDVRDSIAVVAAGSSGVFVVDILPPEAAHVIGSISGGMAYEVQISGGIAYVANDLYGLRMIDITNPANPHIAGEWDTLQRTNDIAIAFPFAYLAVDSDGLQIVNVSDPAAPFLTGTVGTPFNARDVAVKGDYVYISQSHNSIPIVDVSDPYAPQIAATLMGVGTPGDVCVSGNRLFVAAFDDGVRVFNLATPTDPQYLGSYVPPDAVHQVKQVGNITYLGCSASLRMLDLSDEQNPVEVGMKLIPSQVRGFAVSGDYAYTVSRGLSVLDISSWSPPPVVGNLDTPGVTARMSVSSPLIYLCESESGLQFVNIKVPSAPIIESTFSLMGGWAGDIAISGDLAVVSFSGLEVLDVSSPREARLLRLFDIYDFGGFYTQCIAMNGGYAFVGGTHIPGPSYLIHVLDISSSATPRIIDYFSPGTLTDLAAADDLVITVSSSQLRTFDVSNPRNGHLIGSLPLPKPMAIQVSGGLAYVALRERGLGIVDFSNPAVPVLLGATQSIGPIAQGERGYCELTVHNDLAYLIEAKSGIWAVDVSDPTSPQFIGNIEFLTFESDAIGTDGEHVYLANGETGLWVFPGHCESSRIVANKSLPDDLRLSSFPNSTGGTAFPNPTRGAAYVQFQVPSPGLASIDVYDLGGRLVRRLHDGHLGAGTHTLSWDAMNDSGHRVAPGVYWLQLSSPAQRSTAQLTLSR